MKADTKLRPLTVAPSKTNEAHDYWYCSMTPIQRLEMMNKFKDVKGNNNKLTACLNHIEELAIQSLSETVMPRVNIEIYKAWLNNRNKEQAKSW